MGMIQGQPPPSYDIVRGYQLTVTTTPTKGSTLNSNLSNASLARVVNNSAVTIYYGSIKSDNAAPATSDMVSVAAGGTQLVFIGDLRNTYFAGSGGGTFTLEVYI